MKNRIFYFNILRRAYLFTIKQSVKILGLNDSAHSIGLGVAIGMFIAFTPTIPLQMTISFFIAWICGANKAASLPPAWVTNPVTAPPVFFAEYLTGVYILRIFHVNISYVGLDKFWKGWEEVKKMDLFAPVDLYHRFIDLFLKTWHKIGLPLLIGSFIWATIIGISFYFITCKFVNKRRAAKRKKYEAVQDTSATSLS